MFFAIALIALLPAIGASYPAPDAVNAVFLTSDGIQIGQKIQIMASEFGDMNACGVRYTSVYRGAIVDEFGGSRRMVRVWGNNLSGLYRVEKIAKGEKDADCAVLVRVPIK
jgi:hypothetical protein